MKNGSDNKGITTRVRLSKQNLKFLRIYGRELKIPFTQLVNELIDDHRNHYEREQLLLNSMNELTEQMEENDG